MAREIFNLLMGLQILTNIWCLPSVTNSQPKSIGGMEQIQNFEYDETKNSTQEEIRKVAYDWVTTIFSPNR